MSSADAEDEIIKASVVYPEDFDLNKFPPGAISSLAEQIVEFSGFASARTAKRILEEKRVVANHVRGLMKAFVLATIHTDTPEFLDSLTYSKLAERVALAEKIIEVQQAIAGIESTNVSLSLIDPQEEREKENLSAARHNASKVEGSATYSDPIAQKLWGMSRSDKIRGGDQCREIEGRSIILDLA
jgi:hypothetical protein